METTNAQPAKTKDNGKGALVRQWKFMQALIADRDLPDSATKVALVLLECRNSTTGRIFPSYETIAENAGLNRSTAIRAMKALKDGGWFAVQPKFRDNPSGQRQSSNSYFPIWERATTPGPADIMPAVETSTDPGSEAPERYVWTSGVVQFTAEDLEVFEEKIGDRVPAFLKVVEQRAAKLTEETYVDAVHRILEDWSAPF